MEDQILFCIQCDEPFTFSYEDQQRFHKRGFDPPRRCSSCRQHKVRMDAPQESRGLRRKGKARRNRSEDSDIHWVFIGDI